MYVYGTISVALAAAVVGNALYNRPQFYTACIFLLKSNPSLLVLYNFGLFLTILFGRLLQAIFLGSLRGIETEHLYERSWYAMTDAFLAMTIFRDEFDVKFVSFFTCLLFVKIFHWLVQDRTDLIEQSTAISLITHIRMMSLMAILLTVDILWVQYSLDFTINKGASMLILFAFEYLILTAALISTFIKYVLHTIDMGNETPWENKSSYLFYLDLISDFFKLGTYMLFFLTILHYYGLPLHIIRELYVTFISFVRRVRDLVQYRRATVNMNERYPDATQEELDGSDRTCIICREDMVAAKKLPCGHIFHVRCLRSWLERQQTCPTCRRSVLVDERRPQPPANQPAVPGPAAPVGARAQANQPQRPTGLNGNIGHTPGANVPTATGAFAPPSNVFTAPNLGVSANGEPYVLIPAVNSSPITQVLFPPSIPPATAPLTELELYEQDLRASLEKRIKFLRDVAGRVHDLEVMLAVYNSAVNHSVPAARDLSAPSSSSQEPVVTQ